MRGPIFGIVVGLIACGGVIAALAVLGSLYRRASCATRLVVIGISVALFWKAMVAFSTPRRIDEADALLVLCITVVYLRRLWLDATGDAFGLPR